MTIEEFHSLPEAQRNKLVDLAQADGWREFRIFLLDCSAPTQLSPYVGLWWKGMYIGVEPDGYTHT